MPSGRSGAERSLQSECITGCVGDDRRAGDDSTSTDREPEVCCRGQNRVRATRSSFGFGQASCLLVPTVGAVGSS